MEPRKEHSWAKMMQPTDGPPVLNDGEQEAMRAVGRAYGLILDWGLHSNSGELESAVHVIQGFIVQHMLQRLAPEHWGKWYEAER